MTLRLRLLCDGTMTEYVFDRAKISVGRAPTNDLVVVGGAVPSHQGVLTWSAQDGLRFETFGSGQQVLQIRDGEVVGEAEGYEEVVLGLEVGDFLLLDGHNVRLEVVALEPASQVPWRALVLDLDALEPSAQVLTSLLSAQRAIERLEHVLASLSRAVESFGARVTRAVISMRRADEPFDEAYALLLGDEHAAGGSEVFDVAHDPLLRFGPIGADELRALLATGDAVVFSPLHGESVALYVGISQGNALLGGLCLELERALLDDEVEALLKHGALPWWQALLGQAIAAHQQRAALLNLTEENRYFLERERRHYLFKELICESDAMREVYEQVNLLVGADGPVAILGEAGSGKELLARALHHLGPRAPGMFISLHCGRLSDELIGVELFGCVASVLAGAVASRKGIFELASGGTVYLEEVHLLSSSVQSKLVRMLKESEVRRIGDAVGRKVDARLIVSTHHDLRELVQAGKLRQDLYLLLLEQSLLVPPLRARREDLMSLARTFLRKFAQRYDRQVARFDDDVIERLMAHDWPGNVRELQTFIEAAVLKAPAGASSVSLRELGI